MSFTIQSTPSSNPSPDLALQPIVPQCRVLTVSSSRNSLISSGVRLPGMSCLLQNTNRVAPISFSCLRSECSSALVSSSLSLSELSTTHMTPSVCSKQLRQQERIVFWPPMSQTLSLQLSYWRDLMLKPRVGDISFMSSPLNFFMIVVLPALSRPSTSSRISFSFSFAFFTIDMNPISLNIFELPKHTFRLAYPIRNYSSERKLNESATSLRVLQGDWSFGYVNLCGDDMGTYGHSIYEDIVIKVSIVH